MKKVVSILIIMIMFAGIITVAMAVNDSDALVIDLKSMELEELVSLYGQVRAELMDRMNLGADSVIGRGSYIVNTDIKAGAYDLECIETDYFRDEPEREYNSVIIKDSNGKYISDVDEIPIGGHVTITLNDGEKVEIKGCSFRITVIQPDWVP